MNRPSKASQTKLSGQAQRIEFATYAQGPVYGVVPRRNNEGGALMNTLNEKYKEGHVQKPKPILKENGESSALCEALE